MARAPSCSINIGKAHIRHEKQAGDSKTVQVQVKKQGFILDAQLPFRQKPSSSFWSSSRLPSSGALSFRAENKLHGGTSARARLHLRRFASKLHNCPSTPHQRLYARLSRLQPESRMERQTREADSGSDSRAWRSHAPALPLAVAVETTGSRSHCSSPMATPFTRAH